MNKLYYVNVRVFDTFEETSSLVRKVAIATDENGARDIIAKEMEEEIKSAEAPCAGYEILKVEFISDKVDYVKDRLRKRRIGMTDKTIPTTLQWHTGKPEKNGTYLVALASNTRKSIYTLYELAYSATYNAWNCYDELGAPDDDERAHWDRCVRYWACMDNALETLNAEQGG